MPFSKVSTTILFFFSSIRQFSDDCCYNTTFTSIITEFTEIDALPCAEIQATFSDGNADTYTAYCALGVCRHVIRSFKDMVIVWFVLFDQAIEYLLHVRAYVRISVFIDTQRTAGMLYKEVQESCLWQFREIIEYFSCYKMEPPALC